MRIGKDGSTLTGRVFELVRADILAGRLLPGQRLKVSALAAAHAVSVNVVREALNRLAGEQLLNFEPQIGFTVCSLSPEDLEDLVCQRVALESLALRRSIERGTVDWQSQVLAAHHRLARTPLAMGDELNPLWLTRHDEFHRALLEACGSPRLFQMVRQLANAAEIYHRALLPVVSRDQEMEAEHEQMLDAVLEGDADGAIRILTAHLEKTRDVMLPLLRREQSPAKRPSRAGSPQATAAVA